MHGLTCICWANLKPFSPEAAAAGLAELVAAIARVLPASVDVELQGPGPVPEPARAVAAAVQRLQAQAERRQSRWAAAAARQDVLLGSTNNYEILVQVRARGGRAQATAASLGLSRARH
jgi:hypothetical protein